MECVGCSSWAVTERPDQTAQGYRRFRCRHCDKPFNEMLPRPQLPTNRKARHLTEPAVRAWLRQGDFAEPLMRYETSFASVAYTVNRLRRLKETAPLSQRRNGPPGPCSCMTHTSVTSPPPLNLLARKLTEPWVLVMQLRLVPAPPSAVGVLRLSDTARRL
jgi:hypothetical protein